MLVSRRTLFAWLGAGTAVALTGCTAGDPRVAEPTGPRWTPTPTPAPTQHRQLEPAAQREAALAVRAAAIEPVAAERAGMVAAARDAHQAHVEVLSSQFDPVTSPTPAPADPVSDWEQAVAPWAGELQATAGAHRDQALLTAGRLGLVLASCAAFAQVLAERLEAGPTISATDPGEFVPITDTDALSLLVGQLHAAKYGYQTALGAFQLSDERRAPLAERDVALAELRDDLTEALVVRGVAPPPAEPAYEVPRPADPAAAIALTMGIEQRLLPFVGAAVAGIAASDGLRVRIVDELTATTRRLVGTGGALPSWPGLS